MLLCQICYSNLISDLFLNKKTQFMIFYYHNAFLAVMWWSLSYRFGLRPERLWISVFEDDDEAFSLWHNEVSCINYQYNAVKLFNIH